MSYLKVVKTAWLEEIRNSHINLAENMLKWLLLEDQDRDR